MLRTVDVEGGASAAPAARQRRRTAAALLLGAVMLVSALLGLAARCVARSSTPSPRAREPASSLHQPGPVPPHAHAPFLLPPPPPSLRPEHQARLVGCCNRLAQIAQTGDKCEFKEHAGLYQRDFKHDQSLGPEDRQYCLKTLHGAIQHLKAAHLARARACKKKNRRQESIDDYRRHAIDTYHRTPVYGQPLPRKPRSRHVSFADDPDELYFYLDDPSDQLWKK